MCAYNLTNVNPHLTLSLSLYIYKAFTLHL